MDQLLLSGGGQILSQGLLGVICIFLLYVIRLREKELKDERAGRLADAEKYQTKLDELQDSRLVEAKATLEVVSSVKEQLIAFKTAQDIFIASLSETLREWQHLLTITARSRRGPRG